MSRRGSGCLTALALVLSIAFVALAATLVMLVASGGAYARLYQSQFAGSVVDVDEELTAGHQS